MDAERITCQDCGRTLRAAKSIAARRGPTCAAKIRRAAAASAAKPEQVAKAVELIADDGGIVPTSRPGVYAAVSSDGTTIYVTNLNDGTCTCPAGQHGRYCYHLAAAQILATVRTSRRAA